MRCLRVLSDPEVSTGASTVRPPAFARRVDVEAGDFAGVVLIGRGRAREGRGGTERIDSVTDRTDLIEALEVVLRKAGVVRVDATEPALAAATEGMLVVGRTVLIGVRIDEVDVVSGRAIGVRGTTGARGELVEGDVAARTAEVSEGARREAVSSGGTRGEPAYLGERDAEATGTTAEVEGGGGGTRVGFGGEVGAFGTGASDRVARVDLAVDAALSCRMREPATTGVDGAGRGTDALRTVEVRRVAGFAPGTGTLATTRGADGPACAERRPIEAARAAARLATAARAELVSSTGAFLAVTRRPDREVMGTGFGEPARRSSIDTSSSGEG